MLPCPYGQTSVFINPRFPSAKLSTALATATPITVLREYGRGPDTLVLVGRRDLADGSDLVALKVLRSRTAGDANRLAEACREQRALGRLDHRHIVAHQDFGLFAGHPTLMSPFVEGVDLLELVEVLRETGVSVPARVSCEILRATASALDVAMNRPPFGKSAGLGMAHRDLKPQNLMLDRDGELRVLDFGCGYTSLAGQASRSGALQKGLIRYISPQRRLGDPAGPTDDMYALGIFAVELLRGRWLRRLRGKNPAHDRHLAEVVANLNSLRMRSGADERSLRSILLRMVAYDPDARPSAAEVAQTFRRLADRAPGSSLISFAHDHAIPWLEPIHNEPNPDFAGHSFLPFKEEVPRFDSPGEFAPTDTPRAAMSREWVETSDGWEEATDDITLTENLAEITAKALREHRQTAPGGMTHPPQPSPLSLPAETPAPATRSQPQHPGAMLVLALAGLAITALLTALAALAVAFVVALS
jgi:serine/threonine protein kinase